MVLFHLYRLSLERVMFLRWFCREFQVGLLIQYISIQTSAKEVALHDPGVCPSSKVGEVVNQSIRVSFIRHSSALTMTRKIARSSYKNTMVLLISLVDH